MTPAPESRVAAVVDVRDPSRLVECAVASRQAAFQRLVRHYLSQILHGCTNPVCDTPTCLSCTSAGSARPVRPPTQLTARALAHYLASQDHAHRGLCPHELKVPPSSFDIAQAPGGADRSVADAIQRRHQTKKDAKSLSQNLFDTATLIYSYSRMLPTPASLLETIRSRSTYAPHDTTRPDKTTPKQHDQAHSHPYTSQRSPQVLTNGHQLHKIPYHLHSPTTSPKIDRTAVGRGRVQASKAVKPPPTRVEEANNVTGYSAQSSAAIPVAPRLTCSVLEELKDLRRDGKEKPGDDSYYSLADHSQLRLQPSKLFIARSLFYTLSHTEALLESFHEANTAFASSPLPHLDSTRLTDAFRGWSHEDGAVIYESLCSAVEALFVPPPELDVHNRRLRRKPVPQLSSMPRYISNSEAAHIVIICIHALTSSISTGSPHTWAQIRSHRSCGVILSNAAPDATETTSEYLAIIDELEYEPALRLLKRLLCGIGARSCFQHIVASLDTHDWEQEKSKATVSDSELISLVLEHLRVVEGVALAGMNTTMPTDTYQDEGWSVTSTLVEWLKTIVLKHWDSKAEINKWSSVGVAVALFRAIYPENKALRLHPQTLEIPFLHDRLDTVNEPMKFLQWQEQPNTMHILQCPNLFRPGDLVRYFRTINFSSMMAQYDHTTRIQQMQRSLEIFLSEPHEWMIKSRLKVTLSDYLILDISREDPLRDTLDQMWGLEKRMLLKPLKVKMGQYEGEVGADHGGVTYEFFRVVLSEAFKPDYGMFTLDPRTRMTWFLPNTLEPNWKFEMIGILFSLAVYNGITLPVTFPLALYHYLIPTEAPLRKSKVNVDEVEFIQDGWPELARSFHQLLNWSDGDVESAIMREYVFSYEAFGQQIHHNMNEAYIAPQQGSHAPVGSLQEQSQTASPEPKLVTNENREQFVRDYIKYLTYLSIAPQLDAFLKGFLTCLNPRSLHLFSPHSLRKLVEGEQHISIRELRLCTRYEEGYTATHSTIRHFWSVVEKLSQDDCRHLLEFVTASDRVPVTGYAGITFHIVRLSDVEGSRMLPTSSTCFGKLYLPDYKERESLQPKLELAIRNSKGFGVV